MKNNNYICRMNNNVDLKPLLIDLEANNIATGGKQENFVQPERLSGEDNMYIVYWIHLKEHTNIYSEGYVGITQNYKDRIKAHKKSKRNSHFNNAKFKYGWDNLIITIKYKNLTLKEALSLEENFRPFENIGWNSQKGGILGVEKEWYNLPENKLKHFINTSKATKIGISIKDSKEKRSLRAKNNWINNKESYKDSFKGSKNPRAILNEEKVKCIKCDLIPKGKTDKEISILYNVKPYVITWIRKLKNWKHIICDSPDHK